MLKEKLQQFFLDRLAFSTMTYPAFTNDMYDDFEKAYHQLQTGESESYQGAYPLHFFLYYIIENKNCLVHGSKQPNIGMFEPREQTLANGTPVTAIFASSDGLWSLFFAVINRTAYKGTLKNLCVLTEKKRYYYFSLNRDWSGELWSEGTIYILPRAAFIQGGSKAEWIAEQPLPPIAKLKVTPDDFIFRSIMKGLFRRDKK
ncbi:hypothetical protein [Gracilibacillus alcaliphilus]|uniref:hypothetical protein n=1 Tax=Gracilibacillus alcaliphilus TaxID=1401441 RepID=UPI00195C801D|nr:hypothetical protein [Gracilibacillus alcaliphilus]MBM7676043.1 hypothetical protein [Gracilibacillus alcaliphilus]